VAVAQVSPGQGTGAFSFTHAPGKRMVAAIARERKKMDFL
jgi:hypothetical protein